MKIKINKSNMGKITVESGGKARFYYDTELVGFGIKANPTKLVYFVESRVNGKTVRRNIAIVGTLTPDEARKEAKKLLGEMAKGVNINIEAKKEKKRRITLKEAYKDYLDFKPITEKTKSGYNQAMKGVFADWQDVPLVKITGDMVVKKFREKSAEAPYGANLYFRFLRALFNFAIVKYEPLIGVNPCNKIKGLKIWNETTRRTNYIKPERLKAFFNGMQPLETDTAQIKTAKRQCLFLLFTGCRDQEAGTLKRKNIDLNNNMITIENTKNHHKHILPLGRWLSLYMADLCKGLKPDDFIFPANNKSGHIKDHRHAIKKIAEQIGFDFCLHDLRRTFASIANNHITNVTQYTIKKLLNHINKDVTAGYIQFEPETLRKPMQEIEDYILTQAGIKEEAASDDIIPFSNTR